MLTAVGIALFLGFVALGAWQVQRLSWKLDLIERVDQRLKAPPQPLPPPVQWPEVTAAAYEYQPVRLQGQWLADKTVLTQATTALGAGYWVLTPLQTSEGTQVLVNRGFVPQDQRARWQGGAGADESASTPATVVGLLRMSEPGGGFLRQQRPCAAALAFARCGGHCAGAATGTPSAFLCGTRGLPSLKAPASADLPPAAKRPLAARGADGGALFQQPPGVCADLVWIGTDGGGGCGGCGTLRIQAACGLPQPHHP